jgi:hypothetical protein
MNNKYEGLGLDIESMNQPANKHSFKQPLVIKTPKSKLFPPKNINIDTEKQYHAMLFINDFSYVRSYSLNLLNHVLVQADR